MYTSPASNPGAFFIQKGLLYMKNLRLERRLLCGFFLNVFIAEMLVGGFCFLLLLFLFFRSGGRFYFFLRRSFQCF